MSGRVALFDEAEWDWLDSLRQVAKSESEARVEWLDSIAAAARETALHDKYGGDRRSGEAPL